MNLGLIFLLNNKFPLLPFSEGNPCSLLSFWSKTATFCVIATVGHSCPLGYTQFTYANVSLPSNTHAMPATTIQPHKGRN